MKDEGAALRRDGAVPQNAVILEGVLRPESRACETAAGSRVCETDEAKPSGPRQRNVKALGATTSPGASELQNKKNCAWHRYRFPSAFCLLPSTFYLLPSTFPTLLALGGFAFLAGFIDSVVGGGGLIQLPALLLLLPSSLPFPTVSGTNKCVGFTGTVSAAVNYSRHVRIEWRATLPGAIMGLLFAVLGAATVSHLNPALLRPLVLALLVAVAIYTFARKDLGSLHAPRLTPRQQFWIGALVGAVIGFYDGFFGPGTGSFLIFILIGIFGFDFLAASAASKVINSATNVGALGYFFLRGHVLFHLVVPLALCNILGSFTGTRLAILRGSRFVRVLFLVVVSAIICKLAYDILHGR